jgi:serine/threonine protein kinase
MGEVYRAKHKLLSREVAIKILPTNTFAEDATRRRFLREAEALSRLNHPHIAMFHDFGTEDGTGFLVMEFVAGESLTDQIRQGPVSEANFRRLGGQMAAALEEAHHRGIIHRDFKPANVRLTRKGFVKVLDFGIARIVQPADEDATKQTATDTRAP